MQEIKTKIESDDFERKVMGYAKFPTVMLSPHAGQTIFDYLEVV